MGRASHWWGSTLREIALCSPFLGPSESWTWQTDSFLVTFSNFVSPQAHSPLTNKVIQTEVPMFHWCDLFMLKSEAVLMGQKLTHTIRIPTLDIHLEQSALAQLAFPCALKKKNWWRRVWDEASAAVNCFICKCKVWNDTNPNRKDKMRKYLACMFFCCCFGVVVFFLFLFF